MFEPLFLNENINKKSKKMFLNNNSEDLIQRGCLLDNCQYAVRTSKTQNKYKKKTLRNNYKTKHTTTLQNNIIK